MIFDIVLTTAEKVLFAAGVTHARTISLIDWISGTRSQGCTDLQSLVKCLDHRGIVLALHAIYV